jgi:integrase
MQGESRKLRKPREQPENLLTDIACKRAGPGVHGDGGGLVLFVSVDGAKYWRWKFAHLGRERLAGGGRYRSEGSQQKGRSLSEARKWRNRLRDALRDGRDPIADKRAALEAERADRAKADSDEKHTLERCAIRYHAEISKPNAKDKRKGFRSEKHAVQWLASLRPVLDKVGHKHIADITTNEMLDLLIPIVGVTPETGQRVKQRLRAVFDDAELRGHITANIMRKVAAAKQLQPQKNEEDERHLPALPLAAVPAFLLTLRAYERASAVVKLCLEFLVLTATRSGEARGARWSEIDEAARMWTIPLERPKCGRTHHVPLSDAALAVLKQARELGDGELVFPSPMFPDAELSDMSLGRTMHRAGFAQVPHGFRSSFADWARTCTAIRSEAVELALSHKETDKVKRAYMRDPMMDDRRKLMDGWAAFITPPATQQAGKVVPFERKRAI